MMSKIYTYYWAKGSWENRKTLNYVSVNDLIDGAHVSKEGKINDTFNELGAYHPPLDKIEVDGNVIYKKYALSEAIFKIVTSDGE